jgi:hypothetical protein
VVFSKLIRVSPPKRKLDHGAGDDGPENKKHRTNVNWDERLYFHSRACFLSLHVDTRAVQLSVPLSSIQVDAHLLNEHLKALSISPTLILILN